MKRVPVKSSNIVSVGYMDITKVLEIEFQGGRIYTYADVGETSFIKMMDAESIGKYFNTNIKNSYKCTVGEFIDDAKVKTPSIYFAGKAGAGKTFACNYIRRKYGHVQAKFAYPVYDIARNYFNMKNKDRNLLQVIGTDCARNMINKDIWINRFKEDITIVQKTAEFLNKKKIAFVSDDCRFINEHKILKELGWIGIYLYAPFSVCVDRLKNRDGTSQTQTLNHISETISDAFKDELIQVDSSRTLTEMYEQLDIILKKYTE